MISKQALDAGRNAYDIEAQCIIEMKDYFNEEQFSKAVELLSKAERIGASGCGHSGIICQHFAHLMCCIERPALVHDEEQRSALDRQLEDLAELRGWRRENGCCHKRIGRQ